MLLYRALNEKQIEDIENNIIYSSLIISHKNNFGNNIRQREINYNRCFQDKAHIAYKMSFILGHTRGVLLESGRSPWISITKNFSAVLKYATLEKCSYNLKDIRYIVCFEIDDDKIIEYKENMMLKDFEKIVHGYPVNISNKNMNKFYHDGLIPKIDECQDIIENNKERASLKKTLLRQNNYAYNDEELLVFGQILLENKIVITPTEIDNLYNNENIEEIKYKISQCENLEQLKEVYNYEIQNKTLVKRKSV